jgi:ABC-type multidrug transport system fused ATPase/permease subunit
MVLEQNSLEQKTKELDELINLAENISSQIQLLEDRLRFNLFGVMMLATLVNVILLVFSLTSDSFAISNNYPSLILFFITLAMIIFTLIQHRKDRATINKEIVVLTKLYNMITTHKRSVDNDLGILSNTIYEMRLSRIEFNFDNPSKNLFFRLITLILP